MSPSKVSTIVWDKYYNIVDGKQRGSSEIHNSVNPSTGGKLWDCPIASKQDLEDAVAAAKRAFPSWSQTPVEKRKEMLNKFTDLYDSYKDEFINILGQENGKPVRINHRLPLSSE